jgi:hypothetical protein
MYFYVKFNSLYAGATKCAISYCKIWKGVVVVNTVKLGYNKCRGTAYFVRYSRYS